MKLLHLRGRKVNDAVLRRGRVWKGKTMIIRWLSGLPPTARRKRAQGGLYVGTMASTKLSKKAVLRNRMRRRCREALRLLVRELEVLPTAQLLLCPRAASLHAPFRELENDVQQFLAILR